MSKKQEDINSLFKEEREKFHTDMNRWFTIITIVLSVVGLSLLLLGTFQIVNSIKMSDLKDSVKTVSREQFIQNRKIMMLQKTAINKPIFDITQDILYWNILELKAIYKSDKNEVKRIDVIIQDLEFKKFQLSNKLNPLDSITRGVRKIKIK